MEQEKKKNFKVFDAYDDMLYCIGYANNIKEIKKLAKMQYEATDGECYIVYAPLNTINNKYNLQKMIYLETF